MKKLLAVVAVLAPVIALLPASPAAADTICAPITVDGQPLFCTDTQPVNDAVAEIEATLAPVESLVVGTALPIVTGVEGDVTFCPRIEPQAGGANVFIAYASSQGADYQSCSGYEISVVEPTSGQAVHVPQICLTITGTCVGPVDQTVTAPAMPLVACFQSSTWWRPNGGGQWDTTYHTQNVDNLGCVAIPTSP